MKDMQRARPLSNLLRNNPYPGRGILLGCTADGSKAVAAYFIMGRSANSQNRVFVEQGEDVIIHPFDPSKVEDPSLIIYSPIRKLENDLIVTNGDQTDTIYNFIKAGKPFEAALETRCFEPDAPNFTPRISGLIRFADGGFSYRLSILKSVDDAGTACCRHTYSYPAMAGLGHLIHTYEQDGSPLPTFEGEPRAVALGNDLQQLTDELWNSLNAQNRISLYVRLVDITTGEVQSRMINKHQQEGGR